MGTGEVAHLEPLRGNCIEADNKRASIRRPLSLTFVERLVGRILTSLFCLESLSNLLFGPASESLLCRWLIRLSFCSPSLYGANVRFCCELSTIRSLCLRNRVYWSMDKLVTSVTESRRLTRIEIKANEGSQWIFSLSLSSWVQRKQIECLERMSKHETCRHVLWSATLIVWLLREKVGR